MLKTIVFLLLLTPMLTFAALSVSVKPVVAPLVNASVRSCPYVQTNAPDDILPHHFAVPPITIKWTDPKLGFMIDSAFITINFPGGKAQECEILPPNGYSSLLPFYWFNDGRQIIEPSESGKEIKQICTLKCGGLPAADPSLKFMTGFITIKGHSIGEGSSGYSVRSALFVSAPN